MVDAAGGRGRAPSGGGTLFDEVSRCQKAKFY